MPRSLGLAVSHSLGALGVCASGMQVTAFPVPSLVGVCTTYEYRYLRYGELSMSTYSYCTPWDGRRGSRTAGPSNR